MTYDGLAILGVRKSDTHRLIDEEHVRVLVP